MKPVQYNRTKDVADHVAAKRPHLHIYAFHVIKIYGSFSKIDNILVRLAYWKNTV